MESDVSHPPGRAPRLLLVENDPEQRGALRATLEAGGIQVLGAAEDGREAVALANQLRPDVLLMDLTISRLEAYEAVLLIREAHPWMQAIFLTGHSELMQGDTATDLGAFACVGRDAPPEEIVDVVVQAWTFGQQVRREEITGSARA
jgi:DNA-binding NarL/FixJ family response regulator